jgi:hypothetical protein
VGGWSCIFAAIGAYLLRKTTEKLSTPGHRTSPGGHGSSMRRTCTSQRRCARWLGGRHCWDEEEAHRSPTSKNHKPGPKQGRPQSHTGVLYGMAMGWRGWCRVCSPCHHHLGELECPGDVSQAVLQRMIVLKAGLVHLETRTPLKQSCCGQQGNKCVLNNYEGHVLLCVYTRCRTRQSKEHDLQCHHENNV